MWEIIILLVHFNVWYLNHDQLLLEIMHDITEYVYSVLTVRPQLNLLIKLQLPTKWMRAPYIDALVTTTVLFKLQYENFCAEDRNQVYVFCG